MDRVIGGWEVAPIFTYYSGRPFTVFSGSDTFGSVVQSTVNCNNCSQNFGQVQDYNGYKWFFNPDTDKHLFTRAGCGAVGEYRQGLFLRTAFHRHRYGLDQAR